MGSTSIVLVDTVITNPETSSEVMIKVTDTLNNARVLKSKLIETFAKRQYIIHNHSLRDNYILREIVFNMFMTKMLPIRLELTALISELVEIINLRRIDYPMTFYKNIPIVNSIISDSRGVLNLGEYRSVLDYIGSCSEVNNLLVSFEEKPIEGIEIPQITFIPRE